MSADMQGRGSRRRTGRLAGVVGLVVAGLVIAGCYGNPIPLVDPAPNGCQPVKLLLVGDSLMVRSEDAIVAELQAAGYPVDVLSIARGGSSSYEYGIFVPDTGYPDPRAELQAVLAEFQPDVVLVNWGINPPWSLWLVPRRRHLTEWATRVTMRQTVDIVNESGAELFWTTIPPRGDSEEGWAYHANEWVKALGVPLVDWRAAVTSEFDTYETFLKYREDDHVRPVRTEDHLHLTPEGVDRVARWTADALAPVACGEP